jgi:hypothetical protein
MGVSAVFVGPGARRLPFAALAPDDSPSLLELTWEPAGDFRREPAVNSGTFLDPQIMGKWIAAHDKGVFPVIETIEFIGFLRFYFRE